MSAKKLAYAVRFKAAELDTPEHADHAELIRVLARIVEGKTIDRAFGAPGDWGYGTDIGDALFAMLKEPATSDEGGAE